MPPKKGKTTKTSAKAQRQAEQEQEDRERQLDRERETEEQERLLAGAVDDEYDSEGSIGSRTGKRKEIKSYNFTADEETKLVEFFENHDCFYNKGSPHYMDTQFKNKLLTEMGKTLNKNNTGKKFIHYL
jgi:hypothetical protein